MKQRLIVFDRVKMVQSPSNNGTVYETKDERHLVRVQNGEHDWFEISRTGDGIRVRSVEGNALCILPSVANDIFIRTDKEMQ